MHDIAGQRIRKSSALQHGMKVQYGYGERRMLQIVDVTKQYHTGDLVQTALDHVSLNLRDNEFVAILGPSGSGKTTLLNIIGGLDRYDSGDLVINGISTKKYKDRDWDAYRNHTIGFVFQSYNLIPHQTVLANVELALTISGISRAERRQRAIDALEKVGLKEQIHKYPTQMSGGQMQRVAIARALVNDPDILLADEPTGALDSKTSIQVMDLLKEVADDRLVVMVTHNPQLAEQYATRIVNLKDGHIISDTDPYMPSDVVKAEHKVMKHTGMSFLTALGLSFNNLRTKLARTLLVAFAGSIGIIGIASIQSLSNGVNGYIKNVEQQTLSTYPVEIDKTSFSLSDMADQQQAQVAEAMSEDRGDTVKERKMITALFANTSENDLASFRNWIESDESRIKDYAKDIEYAYGITPLIYRLDGEQVHQVNPSPVMNALGLGNSMFMSGSVFYALPDDESLYMDQYDIKAGRMPEAWNECAVVLQQAGSISDLMLYTLGLKNPDELDDMLEKYQDNETVKLQDSEETWTYDQLIGGTFRLVNNADCYEWDEDYGIYTDRSDDMDYMKDLVKKGEVMTVTGVIVPKAGTEMASLNPGIGFTRSLGKHLIEEGKTKAAVQYQLDHDDTDVFTGRKFNDNSDISESLDLTNLFSVDEDAIRSAFSVDQDKLQLSQDDFGSMDYSDMDFSSLIDAEALKNAMPSMSDADVNDIIGQVKFTQDASKKLEDLFTDIVTGYLSVSGDNGQSRAQNILDQVVDGMNVYAMDVENGAAKTLVPLLNEKISGKEDLIKDVLTSFSKQIAADLESYAVDHPLAPDATDEERTQYLQEFLDYEAQQKNFDENEKNIFEHYTELLITTVGFKKEDAQEIAKAVAEGYESYAGENNLTTISVLVDDFTAYLSESEIQEKIQTTALSCIDTSGVSSAANDLVGEMTTAFAGALNTQISNAMTNVMGQISTKLTEAMNTAVTKLAENLPNAFHVNPDVMANALKMNLDGKQLQSLLKSLLSTGQTDLQTNLAKLGYADYEQPVSIFIYPKDFNSKSGIVQCITDYNDAMQAKGMDDKVIHYSDITASIMTSITRIVNVIGWVLLAVTAISLVVSSIMIGVITYISVLERKKEIGILRAIGASKGNVANVFNAETFITGLLAGLMGIGFTELLLIPANIAIRKMASTNQITAYLPLTTMLELVALSIGLTLLSGLIPAGKASRSDPVEALRTE